jgi:hypothetical protein
MLPKVRTGAIGEPVIFIYKVPENSGCLDNNLRSQQHRHSVYRIFAKAGRRQCCQTTQGKTHRTFPKSSVQSSTQLTLSKYVFNLISNLDSFFFRVVCSKRYSDSSFSIFVRDFYCLNNMRNLCIHRITGRACRNANSF